MPTLSPQNAVFLAFLAAAAAHSVMTQPQSTSPGLCRLGGDPQFGVDNCEGPCDLRAIEGGYSNFGSPDNPAATYARGETVTIKYTRNNHGPGGFVRLTLVRPEDMMNKDVHKQNAFYYSCWGAKAVEAAPEELPRDEKGFSFIGTDAEQHDLAPGYYITEMKVPDVIPDGQYVLGWAWYGGTGGQIVAMEQEPKEHGYFGDYWACSYVTISGGDPLQQEYTPVFNNDMQQYSTEGCMSANDDTGICTYEPCLEQGSYQKPKPFKEGSPAALTPAQFGGDAEEAQPVPPSDETDVDNEERQRACECLTYGNACDERLVGLSGDTCTPFTHAHEQTQACRETCCPLCTSEETSSSEWCMKDNVVRECKLPEPVAPAEEPSTDSETQKRSCECLTYGAACDQTLADLTENHCTTETHAHEQPSSCRESCCAYCMADETSSSDWCKQDNVVRECQLPEPPKLETDVNVDVYMEQERSCECITYGNACDETLVELTGSRCNVSTHAHEQTAECREACCVFCTSEATSWSRTCKSENVIRECEL